MLLIGGLLLGALVGALWGFTVGFDLHHYMLRDGDIPLQQMVEQLRRYPPPKSKFLHGLAQLMAKAGEHIR